MPKLFRLILAFLISLGERGEIGDEVPVDTTDETPAVDTDTGGGGEVETGATEVQPADTGDWRQVKYGADWENNLDYHKDTVRYLRGELDKAKKTPRQSYRGVEEQEQPKNGNQAQETDEYGNVKTVADVFKRVDSMLSEREKQINFRNSMRAVRESETGDPEHGIPSFAELEQGYLLPLIQQNPALKELLREMPNPGQAAYTLGFILKYPSIDKLRQLFAGEAREQLGNKINQISKEAVRINGRRDGQTSKGPTPEQIRNMTPVEFRKYEQQQTGRAT